MTSKYSINGSDYLSKPSGEQLRFVSRLDAYHAVMTYKDETLLRYGVVKSTITPVVYKKLPATWRNWFKPRWVAKFMFEEGKR